MHDKRNYQDFSDELLIFYDFNLFGKKQLFGDFFLNKSIHFQ